MSGVQQVPVAAEASGQRLDRWFKQHFPQVTHGRLEKMLRKGEIRVDGRRAKASSRLEEGQVVRVPPLPAADVPAAAAERETFPEVSAADAKALRDAVLYKDDGIIALNKPAGLAVQGGSGQRRHIDGMLEALRFGSGERPRLVHRLDRDTAGVLLLARNAPMARALTAAFRGKETQKIYWALVAGTPPERRGVIDLPLAKQAQAGKGRRGEAMAPDEGGGRPARTLFQVVESHRDRKSGETVTWLVLLPVTGRTHQLRVHCAAMGTPIVGDGKYGGKAAFPAGLAKLETPPKILHLLARELTLPDPEDGTTIRVTAPLPPHMAATWQALDFVENRGERALQALLAYAEGLSHSPARDLKPL